MRLSSVAYPYQKPPSVITMPTRKPDVVYEHRITTGRWEREQVKQLKQSAEIALIGTGLGIAALGIGGTYVAYKIGKNITDWGEDMFSELERFNPIPIFTGDRPLPDTPEGAEPRDDGWIFGGAPTILQVAIENTFGLNQD